MRDELNLDRAVVAQKICSEIKHTCKNFGSRNAGSDGEKQTSDYMADMVADFSDGVSKEQFTVYPGAHMGWTAITGTCAILSYAAYYFSCLLSIILLLLGLVPYLLEYVFVHRAIDPLYPPATSQNVTAVKGCSGGAKRRIYLVANVDASHEWSLKYKLGSAGFQAVRFLNGIGMLYVFVLSVVRWAYVGAAGAGIASGNLLYAGIAGALFCIPWFMSYFFLSRRVICDGANGNLSGCYVAIEAYKAASKANFENTEVGLILTGAGAVGVRGAKAWCDAHAGEVGDDVYFVALNTLRSKQNICVDTYEDICFAKSDPELVKTISDAAIENGIRCSKRVAPFGISTDNLAFIRAGLKSAAILGFDRNLPDYYRTRFDSYDNISEECIGECYALTLAIIDKLSGEGDRLTAALKQAEQASQSDLPPHPEHEPHTEHEPQSEE